MGTPGSGGRPRRKSADHLYRALTEPGGCPTSLVNALLPTSALQQPRQRSLVHVSATHRPSARNRARPRSLVHVSAPLAPQHATLHVSAPLARQRSTAHVSAPQITSALHGARQCYNVHVSACRRRIHELGGASYLLSALIARGRRYSERGSGP